MRVFKADDRAIDQRTDCQRQPRQSHHVDCVAGHIKADHRCQDGKGNGANGDSCHPQLAQEDQDHQRAEHGAEHTLLDERLDRLPDVNRLVHHDFQGDVGPRQARFHLRRLGPEVVNDIQSARPQLAEDGDINLPPPVDAHHVGLNEGGVLGRPHVAQVGRIPQLRAQRNALHLVHDIVHRVRVDGEVGIAELGIAGRHEEVVAVERVHHVGQRDLAGLHLLAIKVG